MCAICDGATEDEVRQHLADSIEWYGWSVQGVEASPGGWGWAYTVGLVERFGHPELVVASMLNFNANGGLLNLLGNEIQTGRRFGSGLRTMVGGADLRFTAVHPRQFEHGVFNMWFDHYRAFGAQGPELTALQVVLPSTLFCPVHAGPQPRLDRPEDELGSLGPNRAGRRANGRQGQRRRRRPSGP
ncbi:MAG: DUF4262 domain-containing protein [Acidimicrobiales bacterium]